MRKIHMLGQRYGRLTITKELGVKVEASCDCGISKLYYRSNVLAGYSASCGCLRNERTSLANTTHGHSSAQTGVYRSWKAMLNRVRNPLHEKADRYHNRGVTLDPAWENFETFYKDMGDRPKGQELDRIDNNSGYSKENCRWVTHKENCQNRGY